MAVAPVVGGLATRVAGLGEMGAGYPSLAQEIGMWGRCGVDRTAPSGIEGRHRPGSEDCTVQDRPGSLLDGRFCFWLVGYRTWS